MHKDKGITELETLNAELLAVLRAVKAELSDGDYRSSVIRRIEAAIEATDAEGREDKRPNKSTLIPKP